ncbi:unnamed protein product [Allacma fusca]|uniref:Uncharacterized protein n=1 Tax=Allacma fusca TaxID=39272 RepID=A0A8J2PKI7_9HEXA|nr:unnamed protein product [Allacma fusca]
MSGVAVCAMYGAIKVHEPGAVLLAMIVGMTLTHLGIIFRKLGEFYEVSSAVLESWKGQGKLTSKVLNASRPIRVNLADYYYVQKSTILVLYGVIVNAAITLLLGS